MIWNVKWRKRNNINRIKFMLHTIWFGLRCHRCFSSLLQIFYLNRFWRPFDARTRARARSRTWTHFFKWFLQHCCGARKTTTMCCCVLKWPVTRVDIKIRVNAHDRQHTIFARNANRENGGDRWWAERVELKKEQRKSERRKRRGKKERRREE